MFKDYLLRNSFVEVRNKYAVNNGIRAVCRNCKAYLKTMTIEDYSTR